MFVKENPDRKKKKKKKILSVKAVFFSLVDGIDECRNITAISLKFLLFCCFDFDPKVSTK